MTSDCCSIAQTCVYSLGASLLALVGALAAYMKARKTQKFVENNNKNG